MSFFGLKELDDSKRLVDRHFHEFGLYKAFSQDFCTAEISMIKHIDFIILYAIHFAYVILVRVGLRTEGQICKSGSQEIGNLLLNFCSTTSLRLNGRAIQ